MNIKEKINYIQKIDEEAESKILSLSNQISKIQTDIIKIENETFAKELENKIKSTYACICNVINELITIQEKINIDKEFLYKTYANQKAPIIYIETLVDDLATAFNQISNGLNSIMFGNKNIFTNPNFKKCAIEIARGVAYIKEVNTSAYQFSQQYANLRIKSKMEEMKDNLANFEKSKSNLQNEIQKKLNIELKELDQMKKDLELKVSKCYLSLNMNITQDFPQNYALCIGKNFNPNTRLNFSLKCLKRQEEIDIGEPVFLYGYEKNKNNNIIVDGIASETSVNQFVENLILQFLISYPLKLKNICVVHKDPGSPFFGIMSKIKLFDENPFILQTGESAIANSQDQIDSALAYLSNKISSISEILGSCNEESVYTYNKNHPRDALPITLVIFKDFPNGLYDNDKNIEKFKDIFTKGNRAGIISIVLYNLSTVNMETDKTINLLDYIVKIPCLYRFIFQNGILKSKDDSLHIYPYSLASNFSIEDFLENLKKQLKNQQVSVFAPNDFRTIFKNIFVHTNGQLNQTQLIKSQLCNYENADSTEGIQLPIAVARPLKYPASIDYLNFGDTTVHALLTGRTGCGKSTLLHMIIMSIVMNYHPDDVEIWLLDYGINEFKTYLNKRPPHVRFVALEKSEEFTYSFLDYLDKTRAERENLFRSESDVTNLKEYRQKHGKYSLPRIVVIVDEFHVMTQHISENPKYKYSLENALTEGRKYGFNFIFGNQTMSGLNGLTQTARDQIGIRIAMKNTDIEIKDTLSMSSNVITKEHICNFSTDDKDVKGEFLYCDTNANVRSSKAIYISNEIRNTVLDYILRQNIVSKIDTNAYLLNGEERILFPKNEIKKKLVSNSSSLPIYIGESTTIERDFSFEIVSKYNQNIAVIGQDPMIADVLENILYSLSLVSNIRIIILADPMDALLEQFKYYRNKMSINIGLEIYTEYEDICSVIENLYTNVSKKVTLQQNTFVFWFGLKDMFIEFEHFVNKTDARAEKTNYDIKGEGFWVDEEKAKENSAITKNLNQLGLSMEEFFSSLSENKEQKQIQQYQNTNTEKCFNAGEMVLFLLKNGSRYKQFNIVPFEFYNDIQSIDKSIINQFVHKIAVCTPVEEVYNWNLPRATIGLTEGISALYTNGRKTTVFKPFKF